MGPGAPWIWNPWQAGQLWELMRPGHSSREKADRVKMTSPHAKYVSRGGDGGCQWRQAELLIISEYKDAVCVSVNLTIALLLFFSRLIRSTQVKAITLLFSSELFVTSLHLHFTH